ncbi:hypothetical protein BRADI_4g33155v3 [Brachypodium distachyon]|uniref:Uncharacterized protein n=1 Tax=Brachypodium distachyon TaxID=15368 RepID=A0A0Q3EWD9_BRADI|nr:hypothetical protein BRADI_4g33155v3 [Brachypodium distachyon]
MKNAAAAPCAPVPFLHALRFHQVPGHTWHRQPDGTPSDDADVDRLVMSPAPPSSAAHARRRAVRRPPPSAEPTVPRRTAALPHFRSATSQAPLPPEVAGCPTPVHAARARRPTVPPAPVARAASAPPVLELRTASRPPAPPSPSALPTAPPPGPLAAASALRSSNSQIPSRLSQPQPRSAHGGRLHSMRRGGDGSLIGCRV